MSTKTDPPDEPIIISGGSPLRVRIQQKNKHWEDKGSHHFAHPDHAGTATRLSLSYLKEDRWKEHALSGNWNLTIDYQSAVVVITPENGHAGPGLEVGGVSPGSDLQTIETPDGTFVQITLDGQALDLPAGQLRMAIAFK